MSNWANDAHLVALVIPDLNDRISLLKWLPDQIGLEAPRRDLLMNSKYTWHANTFYVNLGKIFVYVRGRDRALKLKLAWLGAVVE